MLLALLLSLLTYQQPPAQVDETMEVTRKQLRVRVTDNKGRPVKGLTAADFALKVNGVRVAALGLREHGTSDTPPARTPVEPMTEAVPMTDTLQSTAPATIERAVPNVALIVLDTNMQTMARMGIYREALLAYVDGLPDNTLMRMFQIEDGMMPISEFTKDKAVVKDVVDRALTRAPLYRQLSHTQESLTNEVNNLASHVSSKVNKFQTMLVRGALQRIYQLVQQKKTLRDNGMRHFCNHLDFLGKVIEPMDGDKSIALFTAGGFVDDDTVDDVRQVIRGLNGRNIPVHSLLFVAPSLYGVGETSASVTSIRKFLQSPRSFNPNAGDTLFPDETGDPRDRHDANEAARSANDNPFVLDPRMMQFNYWDEPMTAYNAGPLSISEGTGGVFLKMGSRNMVSEMMAGFNARSAHYYVLSYAAPDVPEELQLGLREEQDKDVQLHYGRLLTPPDRFEQQSKRQQTVAFENTLFFGAPRDEIDVDWGLYQFASENGGYRYTVFGSLSADPFPKKGYEIGFVSLDPNAQISDYTKMVLTKPMKGERLRFYDLLDPKTPPERLRIYVRNMDTGKGFLQERTAPATPDPDATSISSLVLHKKDEPPAYAFHMIRYHQQKKNADVPMPPDPFQVGEQLLPIGITSTYETDDALRLFFHIQNLQGNLTDMKLIATARSGRKRLRTPLTPLTIKELSPGTFCFYGDLDTSRLGEGTFELVVALYGGGNRLRHQRELVLK